MHPVGDIHHQAHVVLDQHDRDPLLHDGADDVIDFLGFDRIAAGGRLIEQQDLWLARQCARDFQALERAIVERAGRTFRRIGEADAGKRHASRFARRLILARNRRPMQQIGQNAGSLVPVTADHHVLQHRHMRKNLQILKRARQPSPRELVRRKTGHCFAGEPDASVLRRVDARHQIEQRGLAGAVRPDDREYLAGSNGDPDAVDRPHAAKGDGQPIGFQDHHFRHPASTTAADGTMPRRRKIMKTITINPSNACSYS